MVWYAMALLVTPLGDVPDKKKSATRLAAVRLAGRTMPDDPGIEIPDPPRFSPRAALRRRLVGPAGCGESRARTLRVEWIGLRGFVGYGLDTGAEAERALIFGGGGSHHGDRDSTAQSVARLPQGFDPESAEAKETQR